MRRKAVPRVGCYGNGRPAQHRAAAGQLQRAGQAGRDLDGMMGVNLRVPEPVRRLEQPHAQPLRKCQLGPSHHHVRCLTE